MANTNQNMILTSAATVHNQRRWSASIYPDFAVICSYLKLFSSYCKLAQLQIEILDRGFLALHSGSNQGKCQFVLQINTSLSADDEDAQYAVDVHVKLLRAIGINVAPNGNSWKNKVIALAREYDGEKRVLWEMEEFDYDGFSLKSKIFVTKVLCEAQFDKNLKLKTNIRPFLAKELRQQPIGRDRFGLVYWYQQDEECNLRLYTVEEDDDDSSTWTVVCRNYEQLCSIHEILSDRIQLNPREDARKFVKKSRKRASDDWENDADEPCTACFSCASPATILLCDSCNAGYHMSCLRPPLFVIPDGNFYCPFCDEINLAKNLKDNITKLEYKQRALERASRRMKMNGLDYSNIINLQNDDSTSRRSNRARKEINYNFQEYDDLIDGAIECGQTRKRTIDTESNSETVNKGIDSNIVSANSDIESDSKDEEYDTSQSSPGMVSQESDSKLLCEESDNPVNIATKEEMSDDCLLNISPSMVVDSASPFAQQTVSQDHDYASIPSVSSNSTDIDDGDVYTPTDLELTEEFQEEAIAFLK
ncbi:Remodeling and spacing factor 1 [Trichoplax sp. H2]|nr:Remodeling and spacing factor 1 [Trichoplax sp. H2]|eukprot:RDD39156.1 Remodeling and spacing factor 1 [Trichoplax sp. H2]